MRVGYVVILSCVLLAACDNKPPEKTVFDPYVQSLKKAKGVEQKLQEDADRQRQQVEKQEQQEPGEK